MSQRRMFMKGLAAALAGGAAGRSLADAASGAAAAAAPPRAAVDDRMPAFWHAYEETRHLPYPERAQRLLDGFFVTEAALYRRAGIRIPQADGVARWLAAFDDMAVGVRDVHAHLAEGLQTTLQKFHAALPDFDAAASPVCALPSLFNFDAHLQADGATMPLFFGPDGIVRYHGPSADLGVLFAHEVFHCYQAQRSPSMSLDPKPPVYANLWIEGVATWASQQFNPGASLQHVLLDDDVLLREGPKTAARVAAVILEHFDTTDDAIVESLFTTGWQGTEWPKRAGYYVGWLVARRVGRELSMREMAGLPSPQVRERLGVALREIRAGAPGAVG
jgi:hypothetical protein